MERQFSACQIPRSMYPSILNTLRVIRCLSQCISPKIAIFTTFLFPLGALLGQSCNMLHGWKDNSMLINSLAECTHLSQQFPSYSNRKYKNSRFFAYRSPHVCFPWRRPCDYNTICCMDGKTIQCLPNPPLVACTYLSSILSELYDG